MPEIIPAIIAKDFDDLAGKIKLVEPYVETVQLDIMDGIFVPNKTWPFDSVSSGVALKNQEKLADLERLETPLFLEAHLMVEWSEEMFDNWLASRAKRIILHWEAIAANSSANFGGPAPAVFNLIEKTRKIGKEFGIALNPGTASKEIDALVDYLDLVLIMSVNPGFSGQKFIKEVIPKIRMLRQRQPNVKIEVDGGINLDNIKAVAGAGADFLVAGSAIFGKGDISKAIKEMREAIF